MKTRPGHTPLPETIDSSPTVSDIFRKHGLAFKSKYRLNTRQHKVMYDIEHCRCGDFGTQGQWVEPKYSSTFLFPVRALSNVFRAKFLSGLIAAHSKDLLKLPDELAQYSRPSVFKQWLFHTVPKNWVVYSKPQFSGPAEVVKYIGRYTHSTAISNNRIISMKDDTVEFWFKNTRHAAKEP
jgi:Putative transposase